MSQLCGLKKPVACLELVVWLLSDILIAENISDDTPEKVPSVSHDSVAGPVIISELVRSAMTANLM